jgi:hypothetical protein
MVSYPTEWHRKVSQKWLARSARETVEPVVSAVNYDDDFSARCPGCNAGPPIAPIRSFYRAPGWVEHVWICNTCSKEWMTSLQVAL